MHCTATATATQTLSTLLPLPGSSASAAPTSRSVSPSTSHYRFSMAPAHHLSAFLAKSCTLPSLIRRGATFTAGLAVHHTDGGSSCVELARFTVSPQHSTGISFPCMPHHKPLLIRHTRSPLHCPLSVLQPPLASRLGDQSPREQHDQPQHPNHTAVLVNHVTCSSALLPRWLSRRHPLLLCLPGAHALTLMSRALADCTTAKLAPANRWRAGHCHSIQCSG